MKIIGKTDNGFIVEVDKAESARLQGFYSAYESNVETRVGAQVPLSTIYDDATTILIAHKEAAEAAKKLRAAGDKFAAYFERMDALNAEKKGGKK